MKKISRLFALMLLSACLSTSFTACVDSEDDEPSDNQETSGELSAQEKKVIDLCNEARADGSAFAEKYLSDLKGSTNSYEKSLLEDLAKVKDVAPLVANEQLCKAARAHANDIGPKGLVQHNSSDGTATFTRVRQYYNGGAMGENIQFGPSDALSIVRQLLIDNGTESLGHRKNILNPTYIRIGVAIGKHSKYGSMCVQDFSDAAGD